MPIQVRQHDESGTAVPVLEVMTAYDWNPVLPDGTPNPEPPPTVAVQIFGDGRVVLGSSIKLDDAAQAFWRAVAILMPGAPPNGEQLVDALNGALDSASALPVDGPDTAGRVALEAGGVRAVERVRDALRSATEGGLVDTSGSAR